MRIDLQNPDPTVLQYATRTVRGGGLVLYPTDTIYGLGCDALQPGPLERLLALKGRSAEKGMLVLIRSIRQLDDLIRGLPDGAEAFLERFWPGPLTVLLEAARGIPKELCGAGGKIGLRWPASRFLQNWLDLLRLPLVSTSANPSSQTYDGTPEVLHRLFEDRVDLFLDAGPLPSSEPSTVADLTTRPFRLVREGEKGTEIARYLRGLS